MKIKRLEFANVIAPKNLKHYQDKINEIVDWINEQNENRGIGGKNEYKHKYIIRKSQI